MTHVTLLVDRLWNGDPAEPDAWVRVTVGPRSPNDPAQTKGDLDVTIDAPFHGDPAPPGPPGSTEGLWAWEVVELFLSGADGRYLEVEIGPHGHHLVLQLEGVRRAVARGLPLELVGSRGEGRWTARAVISAPWARWLGPGPWWANATAIHGVGPARRYLSACALPGVVPDFHQPAAFRVRIDP